MILIVMGVCGSGKTTTGSDVADKLGWQFADADEFHSTENKAKMTAGLPLSDQDRLPWLQSIHGYVKRLSHNSQSAVVTCSALKKVYRDVLRYGDSQLLHYKDGVKISDRFGTVGEEQAHVHVPGRTDADQKKFTIKKDLDGQEKEDSEVSIHFIHLTGTREVLETRLVNRLGHFMPATLLQSQLDTLEDLDEQETGLTVDIDKPVEEITKEIISRLGF